MYKVVMTLQHIVRKDAAELLAKALQDEWGDDEVIVEILEEEDARDHT